MSDQPKAADWWVASDGKWYPPETHPNYRPAPPSPPASPPPGWAPGPPGPYVEAPSRRSGCLPGLLVGAALLAVLAAVVVIAAVRGAEDDEPSAGPAQTVGGELGDGEGPGPTSGAAGESDEVDDVGPCVLVADDTITLEVVNNSSKQSTYIIDVNFLDEAGQRVGDDSFFVNHLRPGVRAVEDQFVFDSSGGSDCEIAEVERFAAESPDDVGEVTCAVAGVDAFDDIEVELTATNGSSGVSDYFVNAALIRGEVRIGTIIAIIENVRPGQSAQGDGLSTIDGPADGARCESIHVERTASE